MRGGGLVEQDKAVPHVAAKSLIFQACSCSMPERRTAHFRGPAGSGTAHCSTGSGAARRPAGRRSGDELAAMLARRWPVLVLLACSAIVGGTWGWGLRLHGSRSAPRELYRILAAAPARTAFVAVSASRRPSPGSVARATPSGPATERAGAAGDTESGKGERQQERRRGAIEQDKGVRRSWRNSRIPHAERCATPQGRTPQFWGSAGRGTPPWSTRYSARTPQS